MYSLHHPSTFDESHCCVRFPDSTGFRTNSIDEISPCEGGAPFCVAVADYPAQVRVDSQLLASPLVRQKIFHSGGPGRLRTRVGLEEDAEEERACRGRRATVYPRKAKNVRGQYLFIGTAQHSSDQIRVISGSWFAK